MDSHLLRVERRRFGRTHVKTEGRTKLSRPNGLSRRLGHYRHHQGANKDGRSNLSSCHHGGSATRTDWREKKGSQGKSGKMPNKFKVLLRDYLYKTIVLCLG